MKNFLSVLIVTYWEYTDLLLRNQSALQVQDLKRYAAQLRLDQPKFDAALDNGKFAGKVEQDKADAQRLGIFSLPAFFINGKPQETYSYEALKASIDEALLSRP